MAESHRDPDPLPLPGPWVRFRALIHVAGLVYRRDRRRTVLALLPVSSLVVGVIAIAGQSILTGHDAADRGRIVVAAVAAGLALLAATVTGYWQAANGLLRLVQVASTEVDAVLLEHFATASTIDVFDDADVVDRMEILRVGREPLVNALALLSAAVGLAAGTLVAMLLFASVDLRLAALPLLTIPIIVVYHRSETQVSKAEQRVAERRRLALHLYDIGTGPAEAKELRVLGHGNALVERHAATWQEIDDELTAVTTHGLVTRLLAWTGYCIVLAVALGVVLRQDSTAGDLSGPSLFLVAMATLQLVYLTSNGAMVAAGLRNASDVAGHFEQILRATRSHTEPNGSLDPTPPPDRLEVGLTLRAVRFHYPGAPVEALGPIDVDLAAGTVTAVVGPNGAGKTTFVNLLLGLRHPTSGSVTVDSVSLRDLEPADWFARTALVSQDFARFELAVRESVGAGDLAHLGDDGAIERALRRADATDVVADLPDGLDTVLGTRLGGRELSGGQWQRIAMARGLMRPTPLLLVLDEPTVAMDAVTERRLLERCVADARRLAEERGTIIVFVSHRYATAPLADQILVIDDGRITEAGTHQDLVAVDGHYADMYRRQAAAYRI